MLHRLWIVAVVAASLALAQGVPADWKVMKDLEDACQVAVPKDWDTNLPAMAQAPGNKLGVVILFNETEKYVPLDAATLKALDTVKVVENSAKRYFIQSKEFKSITGGAGTSRRWMVSIPVQKGRCGLTITLAQGADEATAEKVANTLAPLKK
jgi:hypothetical protein